MPPLNAEHVVLGKKAQDSPSRTKFLSKSFCQEESQIRGVAREEWEFC